MPQFWILDQTLSLFCLLISSSLSLMLSCTIPLGSTSASLEFLHSLIPPHYACCIPLCSAQFDTTPEGILSQCWCSLILTHSQPQWIYRMVRVPRKKWTVPQLTGVYGMIRVPRDLDSTLLLSRSLSRWSVKVSRQLKFAIWMRRETFRDDIQIR